MRFSRTLLIIIALSFVTAKNGFASDKDFQTIKPITKDQTDAFDHDINISRTHFDKDIDEMIFDRLGEEYRRANVYDFYPIEVKEDMSHEEKIEMMDYYNHARQELEEISSSKLIRVVKRDLTLDGKYDYAVLVRNTKKDENYLAIINFQDTHYIEPFKKDFLELVNFGSFPTTVITKKDEAQNIASPVLKLVSFEENQSKVLYFDRQKKKWKDLEVKL
jgi:hypothetical protein